jgi:hypothetical protein
LQAFAPSRWYIPSSITSHTRPEPAIKPPDQDWPTWSSIESFYTVQDEDAVFAFLTKHPEIRVLLIEARQPLSKLFGPNPQVELRVVSDPEAEGFEELFGYIRTSLPVEEALAQLDAFDEAWLLNALDRANGKLNFNLVFQ